MKHVRRAALSGLTAAALIMAAAPAAAVAGPPGPPGGTQAPSAPQAGGSEYGVVAPTLSAPRPVVGQLGVPRSAPAGKPPRVTLRIDERGVSTVAVLVTVTDLSSHRRVMVVSLGWVRTGRALSVSWPRGVALKAGTYQLTLSAHDHSSGTLLRRAHSSGVASLTIVSPAAPAPQPAVAPPAVAPPATPELPGVPSPAQTAASGAVFPVAGAHSFGGPEDRFGAPRGDHVHQGQDVLTSEGTPVVAPLAGTIESTSYQAGAAGYYIVEHTPAIDFFFAHCQAGSFGVSSGQAVSAGALLCHAGQTGDATTPHLHFEMWVGGWRTAAGAPIDPLPYLEAWEHASGG